MQILRCLADPFRRYDTCFLKWYSESKSTCFPQSNLLVGQAHILLEYLRGNATTDECESLFKEYKQCLTVSSDLYELTEPNI